jgi:hypothetical protein
MRKADLPDEGKCTNFNLAICLKSAFLSSQDLVVTWLPSLCHTVAFMSITLIGHRVLSAPIIPIWALI